MVLQAAFPQLRYFLVAGMSTCSCSVEFNVRTVEVLFLAYR